MYLHKSRSFSQIATDGLFVVELSINIIPFVPSPKYAFRLFIRNLQINWHCSHSFSRWEIFMRVAMNNTQNISKLHSIVAPNHCCHVLCGLIPDVPSIFQVFFAKICKNLLRYSLSIENFPFTCLMLIQSPLLDYVLFQDNKMSIQFLRLANMPLCSSNKNM